MARGSSSTQTRSQKTNTVRYGGPSQGSSQTQPKRGTSAQRVDSEEENGVKLVTCTKIAQQIEAVDVHIREEIYGKLIFMANSAEDIVSWFKHERDEPFCALLSSSSNTVILAFCLQLADERSFWVFVRISSKSTNEEDIDFAQEIDDLHPTKVSHDQPDVLPLLSDLPNLCLEVGELGVLRISGSSWAERATEDKISAEQRPAGVLNIDGLDMAEKGVPHSEFMRRLSLAIVQTKKKVEAAPPLTVEEHSKKGKKRGRSSTVVDEAGAVTPTIIGTGKTKSTRSTKGIAVDRRAAGDHRTKSLKSTKVDVATGPDTKPGNDHKVQANAINSIVLLLHWVISVFLLFVHLFYMMDVWTYPNDILEVIRQSALNAKRKGLSFLDEQDPAVLGIDQCQNSDPNNKTVDSIESEIAQLVIHPGSKRKR
ncbi:hypothetical protein F5877DRAFT_67733 [Lentinula edodes]|nr:hypothetical protein F5877DRAFT_67733 [Lentinula edodes]